MSNPSYRATPCRRSELYACCRRFNGQIFRSTDATVYTCVEGSGSTFVGEQRFDWTHNDIFVAPSWYPVRHVTNGEAILFSYSDRVVQEQLGLWREWRE